MPSLAAPRILITRLSAIGDCVLTMPMLCALRDHFPLAYIAWAVEPAAATLLKNHPCLDRIVIIKKGWLKAPQAMMAVRRELQSLECNVVFDPQSLTKSSLLGWLSGAQKRIGFARPRGRELSTWLNNVQIKGTLNHVVDHQLELLNELQVKWPKVRFDLPRDIGADAMADSFLQAPKFAAGFIVLNPGAGWDSRLWPTDRYAKVAQFVGEALQLPSVVTWTGEREQRWAEEIAAGSKGHAVCAPATNLPELAAFMRRARLFVGSDTGPLHIAAAVGTPCISLHGTTRREQSGPYGSNHIALQEYYQTGTCRARRRGPNHAMEAIQVESVYEACERQLCRPVLHQAPVHHLEVGSPEVAAENARVA